MMLANGSAEVDGDAERRAPVDTLAIYNLAKSYGAKLALKGMLLAELATGRGACAGGRERRRQVDAGQDFKWHRHARFREDRDRRRTVPFPILAWGRYAFPWSRRKCNPVSNVW